MLCVQGQCCRVSSLHFLVEHGGLDGGANVVWVSAVVVVEPHLSASLERTVNLDLGCVGGELLVVHAESVTGRVGVCEETCLEHLERASLGDLREQNWSNLPGSADAANPGTISRWRECGLLNVYKVVSRLF